MKNFLIILVFTLSIKLNAQYPLEIMDKFHEKMKKIIPMDIDSVHFESEVWDYRLGSIKVFNTKKDTLFLFKKDTSEIAINRFSSKKEVQKFLVKIVPVMNIFLSKKEILNLYEAFFDKEAYAFLQRKYKKIPFILGNAFGSFKKIDRFSSGNVYILTKKITISFFENIYHSEWVIDYDPCDGLASCFFSPSDDLHISIYPLLENELESIVLFSMKTDWEIQCNVFGFRKGFFQNNKTRYVKIKKKEFLRYWNSEENNEIRNLLK